MFRLTESDLNRREEYLRGSFPLLYDVELRQTLYSVFWRVGRSSFFMLFALLLLPAVLHAQSLAIDPNALDLGVVGVGVEARASVSVENLQDDALEVIVGISGDGFSALSDTLRLDGKGSGSVEVRFSATVAGEHAGELTLQVAALFKDERLVVPLQAIAVVPTLALLPAEGLDFGAMPVGQVATAAVIVKNTGTVPVTAGRMKVADLQGPFSIAGDIGLWPAPGDETRIDVTFAPTHAGPVASEFAVAATDFGAWSIPLRGSGTVAQAAFSPLPQVGLDFGTVEVGQRLTRRVTVLNQGQAELYVENAAIEGAAFVLGTGDSSATIAPEGRLDLSAAFVPQSEGDRSGVLRLSTSDPQAAEVAIPLAGRGQISPPRIEIIHGDIDFGSVSIGGT
ncbi:MAG: choice-of-anchor D domain-containing protein, partial [Gemmatimonadetes bacterium]|nr:choice-of-anchor D domain-containing protein [Gemmatimonadota bacterium]